MLHVVLGFVSENLPTGVYSVGAHLMDASGNLVSQFDTALSDERPFSCVGVSLPLAGLGIGDYTLQTVIYDAQTGERLPAADGDFIVVKSIHLP